MVKSKEYYEKLEEGWKFEDFVTEVLYFNGIIIGLYRGRSMQSRVGESRAGVELKYDMKAAQTGNLYIEISEKTDEDDKEFFPSGIYASGNSWIYIIGNYHILYIFATATLRLLHSQNRYKEVGIPTSNGFLLPRIDAEKYAAKIIDKDFLSSLPNATIWER